MGTGRPHPDGWLQALDQDGPPDELIRKTKETDRGGDSLSPCYGDEPSPPLFRGGRKTKAKETLFVA